MNCSQFKDSVSNMCLTGTVVASCSLTQEVAGLGPITVMTNSVKFSENKFSENI